MGVIIDTSIWIDYFKPRASRHREHVSDLIGSDEALMVGVVFSELLRGSRSDEEFAWYSNHLGELHFAESTKEVWERAGRLLFDLKVAGQEIPYTDAVIAAHALHGDHEVYSNDKHFQRVPGLRLHLAN